MNLRDSQLVKTNPMKRYFKTDRLDTDLPESFVNSKNFRQIVVLGCKFSINDTAIADDIESFDYPKDISYHADFIHDYRCLDSMIWFVNDESGERRKYEQLHHQRTINIWFKDRDGTILNKNNLIRQGDCYLQQISTTHSRRLKFVLDLLLIF